MSWDEKEWRSHDERYQLLRDEPQQQVFYPDPDETIRGDMDRYLEGRGLSPDVAASCGWYPAWYNGPRIIIPCIRSDGYGFWQGRLIERVRRVDFDFSNGSFIRWDSPHGPRGDAVCFLNFRSDSVVVVEGPMDALAAAEVGCDAVAVLGLGMGRSVYGHVVSLVGRHTRHLMVPDTDSIGAWTRIQQRFGYAGVAFTMVIPTGYKDLAAMPLELRKEFLAE